MEETIVRVNWNAFNYIHSANTRDAFQQLTEQLFCYEYNQPYGVYRYYNQPYIETMPVQHNDDVVGFQSKYYDANTNFSEKEADLKNAIEGAKVKYPSITKICFYINKEAGISPKEGQTAPAYITRLEDHASTLGIKIEWYGLNRIETMLLNPKLRFIREYFFSTDRMLERMISNIDNHTQTILQSLHNEIMSPRGSIQIPMDQSEIKAFIQSDDSILIVHGDGGCGKSALIKSTLQQLDKSIFWLFRAKDFDYANLREFTRAWGNYDWDDLLSSVDGAENKLIAIDSAEKIFEFNNNEALEEAIHILLKHKWKIIFTIRTYYKQSFRNTYLPAVNACEMEVPTLSTKKLNEVCNKYSIPVPSDSKLQNLLCNLFYLNLYISHEQPQLESTVAEFRAHIWSHIICQSETARESMPVRREHMICKIVNTNIAKGSSYYFVENNEDWDAITSLKTSNIIQYDETMSGYFVCHDVYEEIVLSHIISREYSRKSCAKDFFCTLGDSLPMRKTFRLWMHTQFDDSESDMGDFISESLRDGHIPSIWKDEILIALFNEKNITYSYLLDRILKDDSFSLLIRALELLKVSCNIVDKSKFEGLLTEKEVETFNIYRFTKPIGNGWSYLISYTYDNRKQIEWTAELIRLVSDILYMWTTNNHNGSATRKAGLIALFFYETRGYDRSFRRAIGESYQNKICDVILRSSMEITPELTSILKEVIEKGETNYSAPYTILCQHFLQNSLQVGTILEAVPDLVLQVAILFWIDDGKQDSAWTSDMDFERDFGLRQSDLNYYPSSAFQTPLFSLLVEHPQKGMDFIIDLIDQATAKYYKANLNEQSHECEEIEIQINSQKKVKQIISGRLWNAYRGTTCAPYLLQSLLMALERWLLIKIKNMTAVEACTICVKLISRSHSAAITAVVTSVAIANPDKLFDIVLILLHTPRIFLYDIDRFAMDQSAGMMHSGISTNKFYDDERKRADKQSYRKIKLEDIVLNYQLDRKTLSPEDYQDRINRLHNAIDEGFMPAENLCEDEYRCLYRMDIRKLKLVPYKLPSGDEVIALTSNLPAPMEEKTDVIAEQSKRDDEYLALQFWSQARLEDDKEKYSQYPQFEKNLDAAMELALSFKEKPSRIQVDNKCVLNVAAVMIICFGDRLTQEQALLCRQEIITQTVKLTSKDTSLFLGVEIGSAVRALPYLICESESIKSIDNPLVLLLAFICCRGKIRGCALKNFRDQMWKQNASLSEKMVKLFILLKPEYDKQVTPCNGVSPRIFFEEHLSAIDAILSDRETIAPNIEKLDYNELITLNLLFPHNLTAVNYPIVSKTGKLIWSKLFKNDRYDSYETRERRDIELENLYIDWLAETLLSSETESIDESVAMIASSFEISRTTQRFLTSLIIFQDRLRKYNNFWNIWNKLEPGIDRLCLDDKTHTIEFCTECNIQYYSGDMFELLSTYCFAIRTWKSGLQEWHTLKDEDYTFFAEAAGKYGYHPATLYSLAFILNTIGKKYSKYGVFWLARIVRENKHLNKCELPANTEYYLEEYLHNFLISGRDKLKQNSELRGNFIEVLNFLIERGSTCAFILRESLY